MLEAWANMPRKAEMFIAVAFGTTEMVAAALVTVAEQPVDSSIMTNALMRAFCVIGASMGALLGCIASPPKSVDPTTRFRDVCAKFFGSQIGGVLFTPWIAGRVTAYPSVDFLFAISAIVAILSVGVVAKLTPVVESISAAYAIRKASGMLQDMVKSSNPDIDVIKDNPNTLPNDNQKG